MRIGVVGYGAFGKFFTQLLLHSLPLSLEQPLIVRAVDRPSEEYTSEIQQDNSIDSSIDKSRKCEFFTYDNILGFAEGLDVVVIAVSISSLEEVLGSSCPLEVFRGKLVVDVCSVKVHARDVMLRLLPECSDILCTHPMFGPRSACEIDLMQGKNFMYSDIRIRNKERCNNFMKIWESYGCNLIEMSCEQHDEFTARSQFVTHFIARSLNDYVLDSTPIDTPSYRNLCDLSTGLCKDSMDLFQSLYRYNPFAETQMQKIKDSMSIIELQLRSADRTLAKL